MNHSISLTVNGVRRDIELDDPRVTLLDLLRERLQLTGTKKGCDRGQCGACTVLIDGRRINSCLALAVSHDGADVLTIENELTHEQVEGRVVTLKKTREGKMHVGVEFTNKDVNFWHMNFPAPGAKPMRRLAANPNLASDFWMPSGAWPSMRTT